MHFFSTTAVNVRGEWQNSMSLRVDRAKDSKTKWTEDSKELNDLNELQDEKKNERTRDWTIVLKKGN